MKLKYLCSSMMLTLLVVSCSSTTPQEENIKVTGISLNSKTIDLTVDETFQLVPNVTPSNATNKAVTYIAADATVASVSNSGLITAIGEGECQVTVTTVDGGYYANCKVNVTDGGGEDIPPEDIEIDKYSLTMLVGDEYTLTTTVYPTNATDKRVGYESDNETVATVDENGKITAIDIGRTVVTVYSLVDDYVYKECYVNVVSAIVPVSRVSLSSNNLELTVGDKDKLTTVVLPSTATNQNISYSSSDESVVSVDEKGNVEALKSGNATITVTSEDGNKTDTCAVVVSDKIIIKEARMQDTPILHCWDWSANTIKDHLDEIKEAGFKSIQLSPFQPQKDYGTGAWPGEWWKLYQPLGFTVAGVNQNALGTKADLTSLCAAAKGKGIDVIMDVVTNHLADGGNATLYSGIQDFEPTIYKDNMIHTLNKTTDDGDPERVLRGTLGTLPDLQTETEHVQSRVLSMLKEYIDCGINGFRFDAAKHIETPDDDFGEGKDLSSNFWPYVLNGTTEYAESKGLDKPYYYGEILGTCGAGRSFSSYTKYMSILDNRQSENMLKAVTEADLSYVSEDYRTREHPSKLVIWAESHDTYANDSRETTDIEQKDINKTYVMQASRKDAATLYFARPNSNNNIGTIGSTAYKDIEVRAINIFHNNFVGQKEEIITDKGCFINQRGSLGAAIVGISNSSNNLTLTIPNLEDGNYKDLVTNNSYVVSNHQVTVSLTNDTCVLQNVDKEVSIIPEITFNSYNQVYSGSQNITFTCKNATKVSYFINNGSETTTTSNSISLPSSLANGVVNLTVKVRNDNCVITRKLTLIKTDSLASKSLLIYNVESDYELYCWAWKDYDSGSWYSFEKEGNLLGLDMGSNNKFIVVAFAKGTTFDQINWDNKIKQSTDIYLDRQLYNYQEFGF